MLHLGKGPKQKDISMRALRTLVLWNRVQTSLRKTYCKIGTCNHLLATCFYPLSFIFWSSPFHLSFKYLPDSIHHRQRAVCSNFYGIILPLSQKKRDSLHFLSWRSGIVKFFIHFIAEKWLQSYLLLVAAVTLVTSNSTVEPPGEKKCLSPVPTQGQKQGQKLKLRRQKSNLFKSRQHINSKGLACCALFMGTFCWQQGTRAPFSPDRALPFCCVVRATSSHEPLENCDRSEAVAGVCKAGGSRTGNNNLRAYILGVKNESITSVQ